MAKELHNREVIRIALLAGDEGLVRERVFDGCDIKGPAVLLFDGCTIEHNTFRGDPNALFWPVDMAARPAMIGAIYVAGCTFTGCTFEAVGIAGSPEFLASLAGPA